jgi:hypothetical protein
MEAQRFDSLSRSLVTAGSRRTLLGAPAVGVLAALGLDDAAGKKKSRRKKKKCKDGKQFCNGSCVLWKPVPDQRHLRRGYVPMQHRFLP